MMTPVLKRGSYPVTWQQMIVMSYSGLRGAVGLTLALIVEETSELSSADRDRILFHMAGIALLTLIINATTVKYLIHYVGIDRSTHAETEMFIHSCSVIEKKMENVVESLQGDRFLGDADWKTVWRYIPLFTSKVYWHRIRVAHISLPKQEMEFLLLSSVHHSIFHPNSHAYVPANSVLSKPSQQSLKAQSSTFSSSTSESVTLDEGETCFEKFVGFFIKDYHLKKKFKHIPPRIRSTWINYHRIFHSFHEEVLPIIEFHRMLVKTGGKLSHHHHHHHHHTHTKTTHPPSSDQLNKNLLHSHDSSEDDYSEGNKDDEDSVSSPDSSSKSPNDVGGFRSGISNFLDTTLNFSFRSDDSPEEKDENGKMEEEEEDIRKTNLHMTWKDVLGVVNAANKFKAGIGRNEYGSRSSSSHYSGEHTRKRSNSGHYVTNKYRFSQDLDEIEEEGSDEELDDELDDKDKHSVLLSGITIANSDDYQRIIKKEEEKLQELEDQDDLDNVKKLKRDSLRDCEIQAIGLSTDNEISEEVERMMEARLRVLHALKSNFQNQFKSGWLTALSLRALTEHINVQIDQDGRVLSEWKKLGSQHSIPLSTINRIQKLSQHPPFSTIFNTIIYKMMEFIFELASNFIHAHETINLPGLVGGLGEEVMDELLCEFRKELSYARETLTQQLPPFPSIGRALKTTMATRFILSKQRDFIEHMFEEGALSETDAEMMVHENNRMHLKLGNHPHFEELPTLIELLHLVPFLSDLNEEDYSWIADGSVCAEEFHGSNTMLIEKGDDKVCSRGKKKQRNGWYVVMRGSVNEYEEFSEEIGIGTAPTKSLNMGQVIGFEEQMVGEAFQRSYRTGTFVHALFFKTLKLNQLAEQHDTLRRSIWWHLALGVVQKFPTFRDIPPNILLKLFKDADFVEIEEENIDIEDVRVRSLHPHDQKKSTFKSLRNLSKGFSNEPREDKEESTHLDSVKEEDEEDGEEESEDFAQYLAEIDSPKLKALDGVSPRNSPVHPPTNDQPKLSPQISSRKKSPFLNSSNIANHNPHGVVKRMLSSFDAPSRLLFTLHLLFCFMSLLGGVYLLRVR